MSELFKQILNKIVYTNKVEFAVEFLFPCGNILQVYKIFPCMAKTYLKYPAEEWLYSGFAGGKRFVWSNRFMKIRFSTCSELDIFRRRGNASCFLFSKPVAYTFSGRARGVKDAKPYKIRVIRYSKVESSIDIRNSEG